MNVLFVSQCNKRALTETRRILDQFVERRGDRTWQTAITSTGLDTLRKLLRKTARKNTAVACHWIHGKDHSDLLWIVGDARQFNAEGAVPTNTTVRDVLRSGDENDWHALQTMRRMTALAALLHDLGKACEAFQERLLPGAAHERNRYRHEWVSVRLFQAFVGKDDDATWLQRLVDAAGPEVDGKTFEAQWLDHAAGRLWRDGLDAEAAGHKPFGVQGQGLPPLAQAVAWLVLTHHRLPTLPKSATEAPETRRCHGRKPRGFAGAEFPQTLAVIDANWNEPWEEAPAEILRKTAAPYWQFPHGLPVATPLWRKRAARAAAGLLQSLPLAQGCLADPFVMHVSRMVLMLGDHYYSSLKEAGQRLSGSVQDYPLFANTDRATGARLQRLDEHLLGVERDSNLLMQALPNLTGQLAHLVGHRGLRQRSRQLAFQWQDKAVDLANGVRQRAGEQGAFIVNMASTGCGKTLGNARIMNALAEPSRGLRCAFAMGLRSLTLQTGRSFQNHLGLGDDELAIQVGGTASRTLFEYYESLAERSGSASRQDLLDETTHVVYEGNDRHPVLQFLANEGNARKLLAAPLLVCTVDHLTPATESLRGGRQIAPMLRLLTGDLVLDEPDDFDLADLPALTRLVHWAGLLGSRVLLSSATLPPSLVEGLFVAYREGRRWFQRNRGPRPGELPNICCLWVDEFAQKHVDCAEVSSFREGHEAFIERRVARLAEQPVRRLARLLPVPGNWVTIGKAERREQFGMMLREAALTLHQQHHSVDPHSGRRISFGLVRMANIEPLFEVALAWFRQAAPPGIRIHVCVYHSQYPLFLRSAIEHRLDTTLDRRDEMAVFELPEIRKAIDGEVAQDHLFVVLGSPVTEVGRDHDYDWAVVEPSSMRSCIQLAGRVLRHRQRPATSAPNLLLCDMNLKGFERPGKPAFCRPGFEDESTLLQSHALTQLLSPWLNQNLTLAVDARPRILPRLREQRQPRLNLVDLEHARMEETLLPPEPQAPAKQNRLRRANTTATATIPARLNAASIWQREGAALSGVLPQVQPFREDSRPEWEVVLRPDEEGEDYALYRVVEGKRRWEELYVLIEGSLNHRVPEPTLQQEGMRLWGCVDLMAAMADQAESMGMTLDAFALAFGRVSLPDSAQGWRWHPALGFSQRA